MSGDYITYISNNCVHVAAMPAKSVFHLILYLRSITASGNSILCCLLSSWPSLEARRSSLALALLAQVFNDYAVTGLVYL